MGKLMNAGKAIAEIGIDKAIVASLSPVISPLGALIVAKLKWVIMGLLGFGILVLVVLLTSSFGGQFQPNGGDFADLSEGEYLQARTLPSGIDYTTLDMPYINQWIDTDGAKSPQLPQVHGTNGWPLGWVICGGASTAIVAGYFGKIPNTDSNEIKKYVYQDMGQNLPNYCEWAGVEGGSFGVTGKGYCNQSSIHGMETYFNHYDLTIKHIPNNFNNIKASIDAGNPVVLGINYPLGHILVIKGYTEDRRVIVNDSFGDLTQTISYSRQGENAVYDLDDGTIGVNYLLEVSKLM